MNAPAYPRAPAGSRPPPEEFQQKMNCIDEQSEESSSTRSAFGMFAQPLFTYVHLPCSLHFADASPTSQAKAAMAILHNELLGHFGDKQGSYGAGGGGVHVLYLDGRSNQSSTDGFPNIASLLELLRLSDAYKPQAMKWMTTADPMHQQLFPKRKETQDEDDGFPFSFLDALVNLLMTHREVYSNRIVQDVPRHVTANYPSLAIGRVLFLLPRFAHMHDGDCLAEPTYCPTAVAFANRPDPNVVWSDFQNRPEANIGVIFEESLGGVAKEAGDIYESPVLCLFQLQATGEILALVQWDYRD